MTNIARIEKAFPFNKYFLELNFTPEERNAIDKFIKILKGKEITDFDFLNDLETEELENVFPDKIRYEKMKEKLKDALKKVAITNNDLIADKIIFDNFGFGKIGDLLLDQNLEEIMVNGPNKNVFVYHREYGMCKTNVKIPKEELINFIQKLAKTVGKNFDEKNPFLDARLSEGSRVNATYDYVTPFGITLTIRKFTQKPLSITQLLKNNTITYDLAAFLWLAIDGFNLEPQNILIVGGTGTGKTTLLIALTSFIRYSNRIITIEDTPEINLEDRENWISMESRTKTNFSEEISMDDLLKNALRMRPDRIIVGEVRGKEAQTLFTAMNTGHRGILGTLHANTPKETIIRLKSNPMNVPENYLPMLNLIVNIRKYYNKNRGLERKIAEVAELERMENQVLISNIFEIQEDQLKKTNVPSRTLEKLAEIANVSKNEVFEEIELRKQILKKLVEEEIFDYLQITKIVQKYYEDPELILKEL